MSTRQTSTKQTNGNLFPVLKFDYDFNVIHCNEPAQPLLSHWKCSEKNPLPIRVLENHPEIYVALRSNKIPDIKIQMTDRVIDCSIVPFPEAGYIGIYAYQVEFADKVHQKVAIV